MTTSHVLMVVYVSTVLAHSLVTVQKAGREIPVPMVNIYRVRVLFHYMLFMNNNRAIMRKGYILHVVIEESIFNPITPVFAKNIFWQCGNTCHSARLLSNSHTSRPIRTPLDLEFRAFRLFLCSLYILSNKIRCLDAF